MVGSLRVGHGFDAHRWSPEPNRPLVLGGVQFDVKAALVGHSDADALTHACIDAVLSGCGLGDIGAMFADTDSRWAGKDSVTMLELAAARVKSEGWQVLNVDCTVITDIPRIGPRRQEMQLRLSAALGAPVTVKGKTTESMAAFSEGVQATAVALVAQL